MKINHTVNTKQKDTFVNSAHVKSVLNEWFEELNCNNLVGAAQKHCNCLAEHYESNKVKISSNIYILSRRFLKRVHQRISWSLRATRLSNIAFFADFSKEVKLGPSVAN